MMTNNNKHKPGDLFQLVAQQSTFPGRIVEYKEEGWHKVALEPWVKIIHQQNVIIYVAEAWQWPVTEYVFYWDGSFLLIDKMQLSICFTQINQKS